MKYLAGYSDQVQAQVRELVAADRLGTWLRDRYAEVHAVRNDKALYEYTVAIKDRYLRKTGPLDKVVYDSKLQVVRHALGNHTTVSRGLGRKLKARRGTRV